MRSLIRLRAALFATTAGACAGGLALLALSGERVSEAAQFAGTNIAPAIATPMPLGRSARTLRSARRQ